MKFPASNIRRDPRLAHRAGRIGPALQGASCILLGFALVIGIAAILLGFRLSAGPLSFPGLPGRVAQAIAGQIGPGWDVTLRETALELEDGSLALHAAGLEIRNPDGALVLRAPQAVVGVDAFSLLLARLKPRAIEFRDLQLRAAINPDGSLSFGATGDIQPASGEADPATARVPESPAASDPGRPSRVSIAAASLFDLVLEPSGVIGSLSRARLRNARLTLIDAQQRERATFHKVDASFEHGGSGLRRFTMELEGPAGSWSVAGEVREADGYRNALITASQMPVDDVLLLAGAPKLPGRTDLKLSARLDATLVADRVTRLETRVDTAGGGTLWIDDKDVTPIPVEAAAADAAWDETRRELAFRKLAFRGAGADVVLSGALTLPPGEEWALSLTGQNARVSGLLANDPAITLEFIEAKLSGREGVIALDSLQLRGPDADGTVSASFAASGERPGLKVKVQAGSTGARTALRLWPEPAAPPVRRYLIANLRAGLLDRLDVDLALSPDELAQAFRGGPIPGPSLKVDFALRHAELFVTEGLPTLSKGDVSGEVTGMRASVRSPGATIELPEGRLLAFSEASFVLKDYWAKAEAAKLSFQLGGGADALAALLQTPPLRAVAGLDLDPSTVRGRADLRVQLPLAINAMPGLAELPVAVSGTLSEFGVEKLFGRDRLENGTLALSYESGALQIKGDGKLGGSPATIDVRQARGGAGEASVTVSLDEAARARKGLAAAPQLTGTVPVRAVLPLGASLKLPGVRFEADLAKAAIDNAIPGWTKPAGKPAKLSFTLADNNLDLRDIVLDGGTVQLRGAATLSQEGQLDRAEFSSFKLSPGDDTKVRIERSGNVHRVTVRGAVADARPFVRSLTSPSGAPAGAKDREIELDVSVNILTGFNDEALTGATIKAAMRPRELRQFQLSGRFRSANVSGQLARPERGGPVLVLKSDDAGAALRFFDIYRRMTGGALTLQVSMGDGPQTGTIAVDAFALRNEPALKRIITQQPPAAMAEDRQGRNQATAFDINEVHFTRAQGNFNRTATRLDFNEAVIWGPQVGFTVGGWIDYGRDRTDISGTFVPAYGLNNVLAQVPLFGPILSGGQHEGLFAINFRVSGAASAPTLTVNPLSAVAPGFLRKLFGAGGPGNPSPPPTFFGER